ncbi:MAG: hypothetical protein KDJ14_03510 [Xanthomonadales bacterium]|nr:hypothetical protein [Xanthomonadales bacterium]
MNKSTIRFAGWCGVVMGAMLLAIGLWVSFEHRVLLEDGVESTAVLDEVLTKGRPGRQTYQATMHPSDHPELTVTQPFSEDQFERYKEGDSLPFLYLPSNPDAHFFGSREDARALGASDLASEIGGAGSVLVGIALLWAARPPRARRRAARG